ncbi:MAG: GNAT family N-acetyltransferase [Lachnospiraceae bacterium]|nr:GNAT family N-acetyltransferase [Lachnospiraceae bacterium]
MKHTDNRKMAEALFGDWEETILWSCLQGVMGDVFLHENENGDPIAAAAWLGDFCLIGGQADKTMLRDIRLRMKKIGQEFLILVPKDEAWADEIEAVFGEKARRIVRYAIKKEQDVFDRVKLENAAESLGGEYELRVIDEKLYDACLKESWSHDLVSNFADYETYKKLGLGIAAVKDGHLVAGASSYSVYNGGLEIEIDTKQEFRRRGLAYACGARLILECLDRGLYPSWDAHNRQSVALAEKLGYHFDYEYMAYEVSIERQNDK